jgi:hypothetical protein
MDDVRHMVSEIRQEQFVITSQRALMERIHSGTSQSEKRLPEHGRHLPCGSNHIEDASLRSGIFRT